MEVFIVMEVTTYDHDIDSIWSTEELAKERIACINSPKLTQFYTIRKVVDEKLTCGV